MAIGNFPSYFVPVLKVLAENGTLHRQLLFEKVAAAEKLTEDEIAAVNTRGTNIFRSRISWAGSYLVQAKAVVRPERGYLEITERGRQLLKDHPGGFDVQVLADFPDWKDAWGG